MTARRLRAAGLLVPLLAGLGAVLLLLPRDGVAPEGGVAGEQVGREAAPPPEAQVARAPALEAGGGAGRAPGPTVVGRGPAASRAVEEGPAAAPAAAPAADPKGPFLGVCVDEDDRPVAGATVEVTSGRAGARGGIDRGAFPDATSGRDGRFEVAAPPAVESIRVRASSPGRVAPRADEEMTRGAVARIVLLPAVEVRVRVLEKDGGGAVRGARVSLLAGEENANRGDADLALHPPTDEVVTDDAGRAVLRAPGGACAVLVKAKDRSPRLTGPLEAPPAGLDLTVVLDRGTPLAGRVVGEDGLPVVGARVHAKARLSWRAEATTDADGAFRMEGLPPPPDRIDPTPAALVAVVSADGYALQAFERDLGSPTGDPWELQIHRTGPVTGTVAAVRGTFPPGATVRLVPSLALPEGVPIPPLPAAQPVPADGSFRFDDVVVLPVDVVVEDADGDALFADVSLTWPGGGRGRHPSPSTVSLRASDAQLPETAPWRVRILDAGQGVAGAHLEVGFGDGRVLHVQGRATTGADGRAGVEGLRVAPRAAVVFPPGRPAFSFAPPAGGPSTVERSITAPTGRAQGRVRRLDGRGAPIRLAVETALDRIGAPETVVGRTPLTVGDDGAFVVEGLGAEDAYRLSADAPFRLVRPPPVRPGAALDLLAVTPAEAASLAVEVRVERPAGAAPLLFPSRCALTADDGSSYPVTLEPTTEPDVWRSTPPVPPGVYRLMGCFGSAAPIPPFPIAGGDHPARITVSIER